MQTPNVEYSQHSENESIFVDYCPLDYNQQCDPSLGMENVREILARNVRLGRQRLQLSQEELAARADIDRTYISGIEREARNPSIMIIAKIAEVLETTVADLLSHK